MIAKRKYRLERNARRFASDQSQIAGTDAVSITIPERGRIADYRNGTDLLNPEIETPTGAIDMTDTGTIDKPATTKRKPAEITRDKANAITLQAALALSDTELRGVAKPQRPEIPDLPPALAKQPYAVDYAKFITGLLQWAPAGWDYGKIEKAEALAIRTKVRAALGKAAGVPVGNPTGLTVRKAAQTAAPATPAETKPEPKPAAAKPAPKRAASAKPKSTKKPAAKKPAAKK